MKTKNKSSKRKKDRAKNNPDIEEIIKRLTAPAKTPLRVIGYIIDENGEKSDLTQNFYLKKKIWKINQKYLVM